MFATQRPVTEASLNEMAGTPAWKTIPSWFIFGQLDKNIPAAAHTFMARRAGAKETIEVKGASHVVMVSHPDEVAAMIERAASSFMARKYLELSVTPAVEAAQTHYYGRARSFPPGTVSAPTPLGPDEEAFIAERDSFYLATISETGWPYMQHRGGPKGFLRVLDPHTLVFADLRGNGQLLSTGNLNGGDGRIALFLMDYPQRARLKIMGHARVTDARDEPTLATKAVGGDRELTKIERVFVVDVVSFDWNCPQHITPRYTEEEIEIAIAAPLRKRIAELEARLRSSPVTDRR